MNISFALTKQQFRNRTKTVTPARMEASWSGCRKKDGTNRRKSLDSSEGVLIVTRRTV